MSNIILRNYQKELKDKVHTAWQSHNNVCMQLETGGGKTVIIASIVQEHNGVSVVIAHRDYLIIQLSKTLARGGVYHNIIAAKATIREIVAQHMLEFKKSFYHPNAHCHVASVDTIIKKTFPWYSKVTLTVIDEAHHVLRVNKWGKVFSKFTNAKSLLTTATPERADGFGLGVHSDGVMNVIVQGPTTDWLIDNGYLSPARIFAPPSNLDLSLVPITASGEYSPTKLESAVHKSNILGCVVKHYLKIAQGKLGLTFAVNVQAAKEYVLAFRQAGVPAELLTSDTPYMARHQIIKKFEKREILQLVTVDLISEGVDIPAVEVISLARPTHSYVVHKQQVGRGGRLFSGKTHVLILDHVGNTLKHGLPQSQRAWSLEANNKKSRSLLNTEVLIRRCKNEMCNAVYEKFLKKCPYCGIAWIPAERSTPEAVEGDLVELDPEVLKGIKKEIAKVDGPVRFPAGVKDHVKYSIGKKHRDRQEAQTSLREGIAQWAGVHKSLKREDSEIYRRFFYAFNIDIATAQTLNKKDAEELLNKINLTLKSGLG